jgi:hypothetical protein
MTTVLETPEEFREIMDDGRAISTSPTWRFVYDPRQARIAVRSQWRMGISHFVGLGLLGVVVWWGGGKLEMVGFGDFRWMARVAAYWLWFMACGFVVGTFLVERFRDSRSWLCCEPTTRTIACERLGMTFAVNDVFAFQVVKGWHVMKAPGETIQTRVYELNIIATEGGRLQRYPLIAAGNDSLATDAQALADYCGVPFLRS